MLDFDFDYNSTGVTSSAIIPTWKLAPVSTSLRQPPTSVINITDSRLMIMVT